jgi:hypothetical protein
MGEGKIMAPRSAGIPQHGERASLQAIKDRDWVTQAALHPAGKGTIATMLRKGWIESRPARAGSMEFRITDGGRAALSVKIPFSR